MKMVTVKGDGGINIFVAKLQHKKQIFTDSILVVLCPSIEIAKIMISIEYFSFFVMLFFAWFSFSFYLLSLFF